MPAVDLGDATTVIWNAPVTGTTVLTVTLPDGTTATPSVVDTAAPVYSAVVATPQAGRYLLTWEQAATDQLYTDVLNVWPGDPRFIVSVEDMISAIRQTTTVSDSDRSDMRLIVAAATEVIEDIVGAVLVRTVTQKANGGSGAVVLHEIPTAVTGVVSAVTLTEGTGFVVDYSAGIVYSGTASSPSWFTSGRQNITLTYTVGAATVKPNIRLATIELCRHMWQIGRQTIQRARIPGETVTELVSTPSGFLVPKRVMELCAPDARVGAFA